MKCKNPKDDDNYCYKDPKIRRVLDHLVFSFHETRSILVMDHSEDDNDNLVDDKGHLPIASYDEIQS